MQNHIVTQTGRQGIELYRYADSQAIFRIIQICRQLGNLIDIQEAGSLYNHIDMQTGSQCDSHINRQTEVFAVYNNNPITLPTSCPCILPLKILTLVHTFIYLHQLLSERTKCLFFFFTCVIVLELDCFQIIFVFYYKMFPLKCFPVLVLDFVTHYNNKQHHGKFASLEAQCQQHCCCCVVVHPLSSIMTTDSS